MNKTYNSVHGAGEGGVFATYLEFTGLYVIASIQADNHTSVTLISSKILIHIL